MACLFAESEEELQRLVDEFYSVYKKNAKGECWEK